MVSELHCPKAFSPIFVTEEGIDKWFSKEQPINACVSIIDNDEGLSKQTSTRAVQDSKAPYSIFFTEEGIEIFDNDEQRAKASFLIKIREGGKVISVSDIQSIKQLFKIDSIGDSITIFFNDLQAANVVSLISLIDAFKMISSKDKYPKTPQRSISVTVEGIVILRRE